MKRSRQRFVAAIAIGRNGIVKVSRETVEQNRERVIATAARLFRERGMDGIGLVDLMRAAGLTPGGFYRQFKSKDDLIVQAVKRAYKDMSEDIAGRIAASDDPLETLVRFYVSDNHRDNPGQGCGLAAMAADAARHDDPALRECFGSIVSNYIGLLTKVVPRGSAKTKRSAAITALAEMIGSVVLSRVVSDPALSGEIIDTVSNDLLKRHAKSSRSA
ncbi:TetR/AcrR family transcriptional regulator [Bradyrhizobium ottawaense]|uniref:TetR/AcrR family transcriptional regulator n=1 Tax=Bradyrhizobium ottawaense TaxID=931866 RepID=UPI001931091A|nr:TetR/AcrR family transcriptional regulator [Bradyrhizobium ottawaense]MBR1326008.1 TetR/AcrR family transcriptional regulator [Bradyrhizobium ottawaense]